MTDESCTLRPCPISTQEQAKHGLSVDNQITSLIEYCKSNGYQYEIYNDAGISAHKKYTHRPALLKLLEDVRNGKVDIILFTKLDRWFRSVADYYSVQSVLDENNVPWKAIHEDYEVVTSSGKFKTNIMLSVAQAESDRKSELLKNIHAYRKAQGKYVGTASLGYKVVNSHLVKDEETKDAVDAIFKEYLTSFSMAKTMQVAKEYGITMFKGHMSRWMKKPCYHGDAFGYPCEPYITPEQHEEILKSFASHRRTPKDNRVYLFHGLIKCGHCGLALNGQHKTNHRKDGTNYEFKYYRCPSYSNTSVEYHYLSILERDVEQYLLEYLEPLLEGHRIDVKAQRKQEDRDTLLKRKNSLSAKLERLKELFVDGDIPKDEYTARRDAIQAEIDSIHLEPTEVVKLPEDWHDIYNALVPERKARFWHKIIDKIVITRDTKSHPQVFFKDGLL